MHREEPPSFPVGIEPQFDRQLDLPVQGLQPGNLIVEPGDDRMGTCQGATGPPRLHEQDLPVFPGHHVNRGPGPCSPDDAKTPLPETVPGKELNPAATGAVNA